MDYISKFNDIKKNIRDIQISLIDETCKIDLIPERRYNRKYRILMPNRKLIKSIIEIGGVLTGSRALKCYSINGVSMLDRKMADWDFMLDRKSAFKIASDHNIRIGISDNYISVNKERWWVYPAYTESYQYCPVNVHIIISDDIPKYKEKNGIKFTTPSYIISEKIKLIETNDYYNGKCVTSSLEKDLKKQISDLERIIVNFYGNI